MREEYREWLFRHRISILIFAVIIGFFFRIYNLNYVGFAEDEVNKINAVEKYLKGDFTPNAEHPMLMKNLILVSVVVSRYYNENIAPKLNVRKIPIEVAVRFPNVLFGALTAICIYLLAFSFFDIEVALLSALLWATGINAIMINRIAKEDTLMVFFILLGFYFHRRFKTAKPEFKRKFYYLSAASFGAMLSAKYFPHYLGLNFLFYAIHRKINPSEYIDDHYTFKDLVKYFVVFSLVFFALNPMILSPEVLKYIIFYTHEGTMVHHGYYMLNHLYFNDVSRTPFNGTPWYFYLLYIFVKFPTIILIALIVGLVFCVKDWRKGGNFLILFLLFFWLVPYSLFGVKFCRYTLSLLPPIYMAAAIGVVKIFEAVKNYVDEGFLNLQRVKISFVIPILYVILPLSSLIVSNPFYSLYVNFIGGGKKNIGYFFPHDEFYDLDLREAIRRTVEIAPTGSVIAGETPAVFEFYLKKFHREDMKVVELSDKNGVVEENRIVFVILQPGRMYFENLPFYRHLWGKKNPVVTVKVMGKDAINIYKISGEEYMKYASEREFPGD